MYRKSFSFFVAFISFLGLLLNAPLAISNNKPLLAAPGELISKESLSEDSETLDQNTSFKGRVVKGVISNATITAYPIVIDQGVYIADKTSFAASGKTDGKGYFQLKVGKGRRDDYFYLEMTTETNSQMLCDFHHGCWSEKTSSVVPFGQPYILPEGFKLSNVVKSIKGEIKHAPITPLTHLATVYTAKLSEGYSPENLKRSIEYVESLFLLEADSLAVQPADLTSLGRMKRLKEKELKLGVIAASFAPLINTPYWDHLEDLSLHELFEHAFELILFLKERSTSSQITKTLSSLESDMLNAIETTNISSTDSLSIINHPKSTLLREGEKLTLSVEAYGRGILHFQWQKGGSIISGATSETYTIEAVDLGDSGTYSVTITDDKETIQSEFADITVLEALEAVTITEHPISISRLAGYSASFSVSATGDGFLIYQWRKDGIEILNANHSSYEISYSSPEDSGLYDVVVSNSISQETSVSALLDVLPNIEPITSVQSPSMLELNEGHSGSISIEADGGGTKSYQWFKDGQQLEDQLGDTLTILSAKLSDQGIYYVRVSNEVSQTYSENINVVVESLQAENTDVQKVSLNWNPPEQREDGSVLGLSEISAYSIMFALANEESYQTIQTASGEENNVSLELLPGDYKFKIATIDQAGLIGSYSDSLVVEVR